MQKIKTYQLGTFYITMIILGSVDSIRNLPTTALLGSNLPVFFIMASILFLFPSAIISAMLSSIWPQQGGIYIWLKNGFSQRIGVLGVWFQWIENVIWYPTLLSFVAATFGYLIAPELANTPYFLAFTIIIAFSLITLINLFGMKSSAIFASFCTCVGLIIPMIAIISLGAFWVLSGETMQIHFTLNNLIPHFSNTDQWIALEGVALSFCGMEMATVHARDVKDPARTFPRALMLSAILLVLTLLFGSLAIALVTPQNQISLVAGIIQAFALFLSQYHMSFLVPIIAVMLILGGLGSVNNWAVGPAKGLQIAAEDGAGLKLLTVENRHGAPYKLLLLQAIIVTMISLMFILSPTINSAYWILTVLAAQLYMIMYILMFAVGIKAIFTHHNHHHYKILGGKITLLVLAIFGLFSSLFILVIGFIPPSGSSNLAITNYLLWISIWFIALSLPPFFIKIKKTNIVKTFEPVSSNLIEKEIL